MLIHLYLEVYVFYIFYDSFMTEVARTIPRYNEMKAHDFGSSS